MNAVPELFPASTVARRADHLWPGERIRHAGKTLRIEQVAVTHGADTVLQVRTLAGAQQQLTLDPGELITVLP